MVPATDDVIVPIIRLGALRDSKALPATRSRRNRYIEPLW